MERRVGAFTSASLPIAARSAPGKAGRTDGRTNGRTDGRMEAVALLLGSP